MSTKADQLRNEAAEADRRAEESFQRSDTDGFLSQWASGLTAQEKRLQADIEENGGLWEFVALLDAETGERVKAKTVQVDDRYGYGRVTKWIVLDENDRAVHWVPAYKEGPRSKLSQLGLVEGSEMAPGKAAIGGSGRGLSGAASCYVYARRTDGGYPEGARTLDAIRAERS